MANDISTGRIVRTLDRAVPPGRVYELSHLCELLAVRTCNQATESDAIEDNLKFLLERKELVLVPDVGILAFRRIKRLPGV